MILENKIYEDYFLLKERVEHNEKRIIELEKLLKQQKINPGESIYWTLQKIKIIIIVLFYFFGKQLLLNKEFYKLFISSLSLLSFFK
jgi:hypothetical protein